VSIDRSLLSAALFPLQDAGPIAAVSLAANARAAFVPSSSVRNSMRSEPGKLYARRTTQQRRGAGAALAVASVNTWVEREPPSSRRPTSASRRF